MEITQAIQYKDNPSHRDNSVPLVGSRGTTVRVYLEPYPPGCGTIVEDVGGWLQYGTGGSPWADAKTIWVADNGVIGVDPNDDNEDRRKDEDKTLNFTFLAPPASATAATLLGVRFRLYGSEQWSNWEVQPLKLVEKLMRIGGIPIRNTGLMPDANLIKPGKAELALFGEWPLPEPRGPRGAGPNSPAYYKLYPWHASLDYPDIGIDPTHSDVLLDLKAIQKDTPVDFLFGWVDEKSNYVGTGVSCAGSPRLDCHTGIGEDSQLHYQGKIAHEFGHELFQNNQETNTTLAPEYGWDVGFADGHLGLGNLKLPALHNIMYGGIHPITREQFKTADRWATAETYEGAVDEVEAPRAPFEEVEALAIPVSSNYATIPRHVFRFTRNREPLSPRSAGTGELKLKDDQGQVLYQTKFDTPILRYEDPAIPDEAGDALIEVPFYSTLEVIELYENGVLRHVLTRSANAPTVTILSPLPGATLTDTVVIEWEASDLDDDPLRAEVLYSKDGSEWTSLPINSTATSTTVGTAALASSSAAKIRVRVSDGFDTTIVDVENLQLGPNRPPEAWFWQPENGATYYAGANVMLLGAVDDLEDATIPETSVAWYSDVDGYLAQGFAANITSLSVGTHQIELRVTDSGNSTTSAYATIRVQAAPSDSTSGESVRAPILHAQDQPDSFLLFVPVAEKRSGLEQPTPAPSSTASATDEPVFIPTPTATSMLSVAPPSTVFENCTVIQENHRENDSEVTGRIHTEYNSLSRIASQRFDTETPDGQGSDGVIDFRRIFTYRDGWLILEVAAFEGDDSDSLLSRRTYIYGDDDRLRQVRIDVDGDGSPDVINQHAYDQSGRLVRVENAWRLDQWTYDTEGRVLTKYSDIGNDGKFDHGVHYVWNADNLITAVGIDTDGDGDVDFTGERRYDASRRLIFAEDLAGDWTYGYTDQGWPDEITLHKGRNWEFTLRYEYDSHGRLTRESFVDHVGDSYFRLYFNACPGG